MAQTRLAFVIILLLSFFVLGQITSTAVNQLLVFAAFLTSNNQSRKQRGVGLTGVGSMIYLIEDSPL